MCQSDVAERHYAAGVAAIEEEMFAIAVREFREAIRLDPDHTCALRDLGFVLYGMYSKHDLALLYLEKAKRLDDSLAYVDLYMALALGRLERRADAEAAYYLALLNTPIVALAHAVFADYLATIGRRSEAEKHLITALSLDDCLIIALRNYARLLAAEGREDEAEFHFRRALDIDPDDPITKRQWDKFRKA